MSILFIATGLFALIGTLGKYNFYWGTRKSLRFRRMVGDKVAAIVYLVIGIALIIYGLLVQFNVIALA